MSTQACCVLVQFPHAHDGRSLPFHRLRAQLAAKRKAGGARIKMGELKGGGGKREEQGEAGAGDLQAQYRGSVKELAALNPSSAHGTGGRGLVK